MTSKQRITEILKAYTKKHNISASSVILEEYADELIANGVIVPPCKVGDIFYGVNETSYDAYCVLGFKWGKRRGDSENVLIVLTTYEMEFVWGEEAFLTKELAEKALKEREKDGC